jgi:hypothetical protein
VAHRRLLCIYLNDHLAGSTVGVELVRRALNSNRGTEFEPFLERLAEEIDQDRDSLLDVMRRLDVGEDRVKQLIGWAIEKAGRLKLKGVLTGYSPLSRFEELDFLVMGIEGKKVLWQTLRDCAGLAERLPDVDFDGLIERAQRQRDEIEPFRRGAAAAAFGQPAFAVPGARTLRV